jgi:hypothetical protein
MDTIDLDLAPLPASDASSTETLFERARSLDARGETEAAREAYLEVVRRAPGHLAALTGFAALLGRTGYRRAAATALERARAAHPESACAHANHALVLLELGETARAREGFEAALRIDPGHRAANRGLAVLLVHEGDGRAARVHASRANGGVDVWPCRGEGPGVPLLLVWSAQGNNVSIERFIDDRVFQKTTLAAELFDEGAELPPHDVLFNAVGDADACASAHARVARIAARSRAHVLNLPERVLATGRAANAARLAALPNVVTPRTALFERATLTGPGGARALGDAGFAWPLLVRAPGFHAGHHFVKVDDAGSLEGALAVLPGREVFVIQFVDVRGPDGNYRKYRTMMIGGALYPLHLAVSARWKVHYFSADMADSPGHRAEDAAFLADMTAVLGPRVVATLERVRDTLGLDYGGIDFAVDAQGRVVVFETNATMAIFDPDPGPLWDYRRAPVSRVCDAVRRMLLAAARRGAVAA